MRQQAGARVDVKETQAKPWRILVFVERKQRRGTRWDATVTISTGKIRANALNSKTQRFAAAPAGTGRKLGHDRHQSGRGVRLKDGVSTDLPHQEKNSPSARRHRERWPTNLLHNAILQVEGRNMSKKQGISSPNSMTTFATPTSSADGRPGAALRLPCRNCHYRQSVELTL